MTQKDCFRRCRRVVAVVCGFGVLMCVYLVVVDDDVDGVALAHKSRKCKGEKESCRVGEDREKEKKK